MTSPAADDAGNRDNPEAWLAEHGDALYRYAVLHLADRTAAEDAVQEALLAALGAYSRFSGRSSLRTWLIGILKHKIVDHMRRAVREQPLSDLDAGDDATDEYNEKGLWRIGPRPWGRKVAEALENEEFRAAYAQCIAGLPPPLAYAFSLREIDGLSTDEIRKILGVSSTNLWTMLHRARARLRLCLERKWIRPDDRGK